MTMKIYNYDPISGVYLGEGIADESPLELGQYLIPANATTVVPPVPGEDEYVAYVAGAWKLVPYPTFVEEPPTAPEPEPTPEPDPIPSMDPWENLRMWRDARLAGSDWTQLPDVNVSNKGAWDAYRQALRDLPANTVDPANPVWPEKPQ